MWAFAFADGCPPCRCLRGGAARRLDPSHSPDGGQGQLWSVNQKKKAKREAAQRRPAETKRKNRVFFPRKARPYGLKRKTFQAGNAPEKAWQMPVPVLEKEHQG